jgi:CRISPR-associated protein Csd1
MLLQSLVRYYEILAEDESCDIPTKGYSKAKVSFVLVISLEGNLIGILPLKRTDVKGKKMMAVEMEVPEQVKRAVGIAPNFLCDNSSYVLGFDNKGNEKRTRECFEAFKQLHHTVLASIQCIETIAVINFLDKWLVEKASTNNILHEYLDEIYAGANFVFKLEGQLEYLHQTPVIKRAWEQYKNFSDGGEFGRCLVTGEYTKIARLHPSIRGIRGGQSMGNTLISFNDSAYESYGNIKAQGLNAPVSEYASFAYGTVLNHMLSDVGHRLTFGDSTVVFWAESMRSKDYQDVFALMNNPDEIEQVENEEHIYLRNSEAIDYVKAIFMKVKNGTKVNHQFSLDDETKFYILAISPNAARISIRFFLVNNFRKYIEMLTKHYEDLAIEKQYDKEPDSISIWRLLNETVAPSSTDKSASPLLTGSVMRTILTGSPYPASLYNATIIRIRAETEINYMKAAIIKAYLSRCNQSMKYKEEGVLEMSLNDKAVNRAYVLGRLFASLERTQKDANPNINTTIKDRYFTSACANPAQTFPVLLKLSNHHISKAEYGYKNENKINEIMQLLNVDENPFPKNLSLEDQGIFILGYYHQRNKFFTDIKAASELKKEAEKL